MTVPQDDSAMQVILQRAQDIQVNFFRHITFRSFQLTQLCHSLHNNTIYFILVILLPPTEISVRSGARSRFPALVSLLQCPLYVAEPLTQEDMRVHNLTLGISGDQQVYNAALALHLCRLWFRKREGREGMIHSSG